jgi:hypothetical protein
MFIPDPDFYPSRIPDLGSRINSNKNLKKICCHTFLCRHKFHKIENYFSFEVLKKKMWANFQRIIELLPKKLSLTSQNYGFGKIRDPRSGIRKKPIPDPGSRGQKGTGSRIRIRNTEKKYDNKFFSPLSFVAVFGSGMGKNQDPG